MKESNEQVTLIEMILCDIEVNDNDGDIIEYIKKMIDSIKVTRMLVDPLD